MKIAAHIEKWERFDRFRSRFDPIEDFELWYWSMMSGGTAIINAALHASGQTNANELFATQIPDVYAVVDGPGQWHHEIGVRCDLIHVGLPVIDIDPGSALVKAYEAMHELERYRDPYVRGEGIVTAEVVARCDSSYSEIVKAARAAIAEGPR